MRKTIRCVNETADQFIKLFRKLTETRMIWEAWADFISLTSCAISNCIVTQNWEQREKEYSEISKKYTTEEQEIFPQLLSMVVIALEDNPNQDFLGSIYMALELGNHWKGQFFTPYDVAKMMSDMLIESVLSKVRQEGFVKIGDCACGAGATLIAAANSAQEILSKEGMNWQSHILFIAQDIDPVTAKMCYIQLSLLGCAGYVKIGDSLLDPVTVGDDLTNYWFTPMYFNDVWYNRRIWHSLDRKISALESDKSFHERMDDKNLDGQMKLEV